MHKLAFVKISNYRLCRNVDIFLDEFTPLVGANNSGKSTILKAIAWSIKPKALSSSDFHDPSLPIEVIAKINGVTKELISTMPNAKHQKAISPFSVDNTLWIKTKCNTDKKVSTEVWNVDTYSGSGVPVDWRPSPTGLPEAIQCLLPEPITIESMIDLQEDLGKSKAGTTIKSLLDVITVPVLKSHQEIRDALDTLQNILTASGSERSHHLVQFDEQTTQALEDFFPGLGLRLDLKTIDAKELFKAGDLNVVDTAIGEERKFDQMGAGAQRAIQMALIQYIAQRSGSDPTSESRKVLLIDEPEAYLHPQAVRRIRGALEKLSRNGFQVIFSTHSPLMLNRDGAKHTITVCKTPDQGTIVRKPLAEAVSAAIDDSAAQARLIFELGNISEIYFNDKVVVCEGETDARVLKAAYESLFGRLPEDDLIAIIPVNTCTNISKTRNVLSAMEIPSLAVVDLDFCFVESRKCGYLDKNDENLTAAKNLLEELADKHGYVLNGGLPQSCKKTDKKAAALWEIFAMDIRSHSIINSCFDQLHGLGVWSWKTGAIEAITGALSKGEDAITSQELAIRSLSPTELKSQMPELGDCLEWISNYNPNDKNIAVAAE